MRRLWTVAALILTLAAPAAGAELKKARNKIPGHYIVVLAPESSLQAAGVTADAVGQRRHVYRAALQGYSAALDDVQLQQLLSDPDVAYVEEDSLMYASATQTGATWGLDRIDQRDRPLSTTYTYDFDGSGVHAYIID